MYRSIRATILLILLSYLLFWSFPSAGATAVSPSHPLASPDKQTMTVTGGTLLWRFQTGWLVNSSPTVASGVVYVGGSGLAGHVYALKANTGKLLWETQTGIY
ncbi:MAG TPA: PQQ-binding-like beta-propeller repeat protein, partial [Ktedonobacteraceae bacterium]|nr:PQQ-binding-like beta-propeller repeat protein [Ktedonobacteraceae bacterium]